MAHTLYIVSGMHRSGTSVIARALQVYGIALPGDLGGPAEDNRKGFFEDKAIVDINDTLLRNLGLRWDSLDGFFLDLSDFSSPLFDDAKRRAESLLRERVGLGREWALKDPRIARLTSFWLPLLDEMDIPHKFIVAVRNPAEVAGSLEKRNRIAHRKSLYLWVLHNLELLQASVRRPRIVVHYESVMAAPELVLGHDGGFFPLIDETARRAFVEEFVERDLHHNQSIQLTTGLDLAEELYRMLQSTEVPNVDHLVAAIRAGMELFAPRDGQQVERESEVDVLTDSIAEYKRYQEKLEADLLEQKAWSSKLASDIEQFRRNEVKLTGDLTERQKNQEKLESEIAAQRVWNEHLQKDVEELRQSHEENTQALSGALREVERGREQIVDLTQRVSDQRVEAEAEYGRLWEIIEKYRVAAEQMEQSHSWRLTAPLRFTRRSIQQAPRRVKTMLRDLVFSLPPDNMARQRLTKTYERIQEFLKGDVDNASLRESHRAILESRGVLFEADSSVPSDLPLLDISIVTYNSARWIDGFVESLRRQSYPNCRIFLTFVDNASTDETVARLEAVDWSGFAGFQLLRNKNSGYGSGHNIGIASGHQAYVLVTNVDLEFRSESLTRAVGFALRDDASIASWELRQAPYEHPKFYDPVSLQASWSSHAAVLIRRNAFAAVGGYEERIFMYGEDVELSFRLRAAGYKLRYLPFAVVDHYTYEGPEAVKLLQYQGSTLANAYIRMRYGSPADVLRIIPMHLSLVSGRSGVPEYKAAARANLLRILRNAPHFLRRRPGGRQFAFRGWDYEIVRDGAFFEAKPLPMKCPMVSVVTRTYRGRDRLLLECLQSVANQTYPNVEHVIVEDGGSTLAVTVESFRRANPEANIQYFPLEKVGRCLAGNEGLARASGQYLAFLDDDDLFFADHLEVCVSELLNEPALSAVYALAWEVETEFSGAGYEERSHGTPASLRQAFDREVLSHHNYIPIQSIVFHRSLYAEHGGFDLELENLEDWNLWVRYASNAEFKLIEKTTSMYRTPWDLGAKAQRQAELDSYLPIARAKNAKAST